MNARYWISAGFLVLAAAATAGWLVQRQHTAVLRDEVRRIRAQNTRLGSVQAENERLQRDRVSALELQQLRSDHAALGWLQAEVDALKVTVSTRQQAVTKAMSANLPATVPPPALIVNLGIAEDGTVLVDGNRSDLALLEQRMAALVRGSSVEVRMSGDPAHRAKIEQTTRRLLAIAKQAGLQMEIKYGGR